MKSTLAWARTFPPACSQGWTIHFIERQSRYWVSAMAGHKDERLFQRGTQQAWQWASACSFIRCFTDGDPRYAKALWDLAHVYLTLRDCLRQYRTRKVWRHGLEVAMKVKGSQGLRRVVWVRPEHPYTAISPLAEVHANHNAALRRRCSAYRRRQNLYAKTRDGLQRALDVQRILHNWVRPRWGLGKRTTPAMAIGLCNRLLSTQELLGMRGFQNISS